mgnify:FL=1
MNQGMSNNAPQRESQVHSQMASLQRQTVQLTEQAQSLAERLGNVLRPTPPEAVGSGKPEMPSLVTLADELRGITARLGSASETLGMILNHLEL